MHMLETKNWTRRGFLAAAGGAAMAPFLPLLSSHAGGKGYPKRLIQFVVAHGICRPSWLPSGTVNDWTLSPVLQPLQAFKDRLVVVAGLDNTAGTASGGKHVHGTKTLLSGAELIQPANDNPTNSNSQNGGITIDQFVADAQDTQHRSLNAGALSRQAGLLARGPGEDIALEIDPREVFDDVFGAGVPDPSDAEADEKRRADRQHVVDVVRANLATLEGRVSTEDRPKIERHLDAIAAIERRLDDRLPNGCQVPPSPGSLDPRDVDQVPVITQLHIDMIVAAMACDLTRVATLCWPDGYTYGFIGVNDMQHTICHQGGSPGDSLFAEFTETSTWFCEQFAYLLEKLDQIPEGEGTMLDNTLAVFTAWSGSGGHNWSGIPFTLAGGAGGALQGDRFLQYPGRTTNDLYASIARLMGLDVDTFGDPGHCSGPLPGLV
jgi:hypothetical protein